MRNINIVENELKEIINTGKANWVKIYELMEESEKGLLWAESHNSYTSWVRGLADKLKVHESLLWSRKKAGTIYAAYSNRSVKSGKKVEDISKINISPDSLVYCEKIAQGSLKVEDELIEKALAGKMGRNDLRKAWKAARSNIEAAGIKAVRANGNETFIPVLDDSEEGLQSELTGAADIALAIRNNEWLSEIFEIHMNNSCEKRVYNTILEFPLQIADEYSPRIDVVILENQTTETPSEITMHGIEIKVSKQELIKDKNKEEYKEYMDYLWLAVPESLKEDAVKTVGENWGIIVMDDTKTAHIHMPAKKASPVFKQKSLNTAIIKLL